ncbi:hypothetical protein LOAG_12254 [Loa loa]|uniref:Uncharacterized protein n=1 Tax=Loa loa TaxID=7209 RepID=A0A1S0TM33_LOALO|nr:hypothetical protein LOAG_12254 [Loa loa]EFO16253.1 hypothetical protein LOAG_12254 [Loa loa]
MPRIFAEPIIHHSDIDVMIEMGHPLHKRQVGETRSLEQKIGEIIPNDPVDNS